MACGDDSLSRGRVNSWQLDEERCRYVVDIDEAPVVEGPRKIRAAYPEFGGEVWVVPHDRQGLSSCQQQVPAIADHSFVGCRNAAWLALAGRVCDWSGIGCAKGYPVSAPAYPYGEQQAQAAKDSANWLVVIPPGLARGLRPGPRCTFQPLQLILATSRSCATLGTWRASVSR